MKHTAVVGQSYTVPCNTTVDDDVRWFFGSLHGVWHVYEFGRVHDEFLARFSLNTSVRGLDISIVHLNDTGNYTCIDRNGQGDLHIHQLTVTGKLPRTVCFAEYGILDCMLCLYTVLCYKFRLVTSVVTVAY